MGAARGGEPEAVAEIAAERSGKRRPPVAESIDELAARRTRFLTEYQDERYAQRYADAVAGMHEAEVRVAPGRADLAEAVARNLFRLMAIKDEYEVARLFTDGCFERQLTSAFNSLGKLEYHMAPPLIARRDKTTGHLKKQTYGPGIMRVLRLLARFHSLRGSWLDPFGHTKERRMERRLLADYEATLATIREHLAPREPQPCPWRSPAILKRSAATATSRPRRSRASCRMRRRGARPFLPVLCRRWRRRNRGELSEICTRTRLMRGVGFDEEVRQ